jgi:hypothetical protein
MHQPAPNVTHADVERIVRRDFPSEQFEQALAILDEYGKERFHREIDRVQLAVLKLAKGDLVMLRREIDTAKCDYRDILAPAEYPEYRFDTAKLPPEIQKEVISKDWQQYTAWLEAK